MANIGRMEYAYDLSRGDDQPVVMEFYIATGTVIQKGEVVKLVENAVVAVGDVDQDDPYLGVAAEDHDGTTTSPSTRQTGNSIKVWCSPSAVFKCRPNIISIATGGSGTTWVDSGITDPADDKFNGGYLKVKTTAALANAINKSIRVTDFTSATGTFTGVFTGGVTAGDTAVVLPPPGGFGWDLNADGNNLNLAANGGESIQIVRVDTVSEEVYWKFRLHQFANHMLAI